MTPKWIPGPWEIGPTPGYLAMGQVHNDVHPLTIRSPQHHSEEIATVWTCLLPTAANAHLIAAAPALYEALEFIEDYLGFHEGSEEKQTEEGAPVIWINASNPDGDFQTMLGKARAALALARGET